MLSSLQPVFLRDLLVDPALHPRGQPHISAASSLVKAGEFLYIAADDEQHLGMFRPDRDDPVQLRRLRAGDLPDDKRQRKRRKPDLEALVLLPGKLLLALGSGSKANRNSGFLVPLADTGDVAGAPCEIDLSPLYEPLRAHWPDLNIEGAFATDTGFHLLQRANSGSAHSACISYRLDEVLKWLTATTGVPAPSKVTPYELGTVDAIPYGFTDATSLPDGGWIFSAVAEDTDHSYADGRCAGSAIGWVSAAGELQELRPLAGAPKVEGIAVAAPGKLLLVTDGDDPARASQLFELRLG